MLRIIIALISNFIAVLVAEYFVTGFRTTDDPIGLAIVVILFAVANSFFLPMFRFIFKPLSWVTLGLFPVILNGILIYLVDFISDSITISGLLPLIYATIIFGIINAFFVLGMKAFK